MLKINYKFNEDILIEEIKEYIESTYDSHYGTGGIQSLEVISDRGRGLDFCLGNVDKYNDRYGKKGSIEDARKDILKIIHYGFLALNEHDQQYAVQTSTISGDIGFDLMYNDEEEFFADGETVTISIADTEEIYED